MDTQKSRVLHYLKTHKRGITSLEAIEKFGITTLSAVIFELREQYKISTYTEQGENRYGETTRYARYFLED